MSTIRLQLPSSEIALPPEPFGFGRHMASQMALARFAPETGWSVPTIVPYHAIQLDPCALVLHYGQAIYEGMKAYRGEGGAIALFRPERNAARFRASAARMAMAEMPEDMFVQAAIDLVAAEHNWVPASPGTALYLRPVMIGDQAAFGVRPSATYLFFIVATPVESLHQPGGDPLHLVVAEDYARSAPGGGGDAKTAGNYGRTLVALAAARRAGFDNVLWLDPVERAYIEEAGITNVFVRTADAITTPPLNGRILDGVVRRTTIDVLRSWNFNVLEQELRIDDLLSGLDNGTVSEVFLTGTATHIAPVGSISRQNARHFCTGPSGEASLAYRVGQAIDAVQRGRAPDTFGWMRHIPA